MKNIIASFFTILISVLSFSQTENQIVESAVSSLTLEREVVTVNNLYLQGQFLSMLQKGSIDEILHAYQQKDFKRFTKMKYIGGPWQTTVLATHDSICLSILDEIKMGLPKGIKTLPTSTEIETLIDDYVTDYWKYTNKQGKVCEIRVYFLNGHLRNLGYWIYE
jgi:hypothetical protein